MLGSGSGSKSLRLAAGKANPFHLQPLSVEKYLYLSNFDIQHWYMPLQEYTIPTRLLALTLEDGEALCHSYNSLLELQDAKEGEGDDDGKQKVTAADQLLLARMEERLESIIDDLSPDQGVFVRLSTQSPKDVGRASASEVTVTNEYKKVNCASDPNSKVIAMMNAAGKSMQIFAAKDALTLLCSSQRINRSLTQALTNDRDFWDLKIVVRKWIPNIRIGREFRAFVCGGKLTAISQYNTYCFYEELLDHDVTVVQRIISCFARLRSHVPALFTETAYVIDFALLGMRENGEVLMVEINPFGPATGAALFDWDKDRHLLQGGTDVWKDLESVAVPKEPTYDSSFVQQVEFDISEDHKQVSRRKEGCTVPEPGCSTLTYRFLCAPNPGTDYNFVSSFGIHIYLYNEEYDDQNGDEAEEREESEEEQDEEVETFVDQFITQAYLKEIVDKACQGRYVASRTDALLAAVDADLRQDEKIATYLKDKGIELDAASRGAAAAAKSWYRYKIATG